MKKISTLFYTAIFLLIFIPFKTLALIHIVAAENFYGTVATQLGGEYVTVDNILQNPDQDPHAFSADPSIAKKIAQADIVVYNGLGYDDWMSNLLSTQGKEGRHAIIVGHLIPTKATDNPHIWYNPITMKLYANALSKQLIAMDPTHQAYYQSTLQKFLKLQFAFENDVVLLKHKLAGIPVTATEPVFGYMAEALGLVMKDHAFQLSIMNEVPPSPSAVKAIMDDLKNHRVKLLFYNQQTSDPATENIKNLAKENNIPIIGVSETQPPDMSYHQWMQNQLQSIRTALKNP